MIKLRLGVFRLGVFRLGVLRLGVFRLGVLRLGVFRLGVFRLGLRAMGEVRQREPFVAHEERGGTGEPRELHSHGQQVVGGVGEVEVVAGHGVDVDGAVLAEDQGLATEAHVQHWRHLGHRRGGEVGEGGGGA